VSVSERKGAEVIMAGYYEACKHQPLMPIVNDNVPSLVYSDKAVFTLCKTACSEGQACRFEPNTINVLFPTLL
jgi:hypothetical protein